MKIYLITNFSKSNIREKKKIFFYPPLPCGGYVLIPVPVPVPRMSLGINSSPSPSPLKH